MKDIASRRFPVLYHTGLKSDFYSNKCILKSRNTIELEYSAVSPPWSSTLTLFKFSVNERPWTANAEPR